MITLQNAAILFTLAALGGVTLFLLRLRGSNPPTWLALGHGLIAATGLGALLVLHFGSGGLPPMAGYALLAFLLAALGGATLFFGFQLRGRLLPIPLIVGHGLLAAAGFGLLLTAIFR